jgi:hypothetical protein
LLLLQNVSPLTPPYIGFLFDFYIVYIDENKMNTVTAENPPANADIK